MGDAVPPPRKPRSRRAKSASPPAVGLAEILRRRLAEPSEDSTRTWGERIADALITAAAAGDLRSCDVLLRPTGAATVGPAASHAPPIDDETARRILEAARGSSKGRSTR